MLKKRITAAALASLLLCSCSLDVSSYIPAISKETEASEETTATNTGENMTAKNKTSEPTADPDELYDFYPDLPMAAEYYLSGFSDEYMDIYRRIYSGFFNHEEKITIPQGILTESSLSDFMLLCCRSYVWSDSYNDNYSYYYEDDKTISSVVHSYKTDAAKEKAMYDELYSRASQIVAEASKLGSDYDKLLYFHDTIILNCGYSFEGESIHSAYGALVDGKSVCEGYAKAFELLCDMSGILCLPVTGISDNGTGSEGHGWNKVLLDGQWYNVDCTWDDSDSFKDKDYLSHNYFLVSDKYISATHTPENGDFMPQPAANDDRGSWYYRSGTVVSSEADIYNVLDGFISQQVNGGSNELDLYCETDELYDKLVKEWFSDDGENNVFSVMKKHSGAYGSYSYSRIEDEKTRTIKLTIK